MKLFEDVKFEKTEQPKKPEVDATDYIKRNLMKSVDKEPEVYKAVEEWLMSFEGGITKAAFAYQLRRIDWNKDVALEQLKKAKGRRTIPLPQPPKMPVLEKSLLEQMLEDKYVAVTGKGFKRAIKEIMQDLLPCGKTYVLQVEELILEFKSYDDKGRSPQIIDNAIDADFLIVVDLEMTIHLEWHIREALNRILRKRVEAKRPIISTWNRYNDCNDFFEKFKIYSVE